MWIEGNYRRNLLDMHIDDWNEEFLSKVNPEEYAEALKDASVQAAMVKAMPHTGLCNYPTKINRMHKGLKGRDFFGEVVDECHKRGIAVIAYFSQVFDNYAYDNHPSWRTVSADGLNHKEFRNMGWFRNGRYGIVCPNNEEYRQYIKEHLIELNSMYDFEGMFLDMTFYPDICYCASCREKYYKETGKEMPRVIDWKSQEFRDWQRIREKWMAEFAAFTTKCVKEVNPKCTIEHQMSMIASSYIHACSEWIADEVDYTGGDYYGGFLQQSFINKLYKNISPNLPFVYHTSRCDPELAFHTTTKSYEELLLHVITALFHNGAFLLVDAINPDGTIVPSVYHDLMKKVYSKTKPCEKYVSGDFVKDVSIWFSSHSKFDPNECDVRIEDKNFNPDLYMEAPLKLSSILREKNIPYDVIGSKNLKDCNTKVLAVCHVSEILDDEMEAIERFVAEGGTLYVSGPIGHKKLAKMMGVVETPVCDNKKTVESFTYLNPTNEGSKIFDGFNALAPLSVPMSQYVQDFEENTEHKVLATLTLPYTVPSSPEFSAIHSNPPGIHTKIPAVFETKYLKGRIFYVSAPIEISKPYMSRQAVGRIFDELIKDRSYISNAPKMVETLMWKKDGETYLALLNEQEESPFIKVHDIEVIIKGDYSKAYLIGSDELNGDSSDVESDIKAVKKEDGLHIVLPPLKVFELIHII